MIIISEARIPLKNKGFEEVLELIDKSEEIKKVSHFYEDRGEIEISVDPEVVDFFSDYYTESEKQEILDKADYILFYNDYYNY